MASFTGFFDNLRNGLFNPKGNLGDYRHAARLYIDNNMRLAPKFKHLFHVVLNINPAIRQLSPLINQFDRNEVNLLCRGAELPRYNLQTETVNQYNRKKIIQTGVQYQPVSLQFHDDNSGLTTLLWEAYFRYYFSDSNYVQRNVDGSPALTARPYEKANSGLNSMYSNERFVGFKFGLDKPNKPVEFFTSIQIFQLHPQLGEPTYTSFTLVNPKIDQFQHDGMSQDGSEFSINTMSISYEAVMYNRGYTRPGNAPAGFGETHYDKVPSPLVIEGGGTRSIFGRGGTIAGITNTIDDFVNGNFLEGIISGINTLDNLRKQTTSGALQEITGVAVGALQDIENNPFPRVTNSNTTFGEPKRFGD